jgi:hypothetical protein
VPGFGDVNVGEWIEAAGDYVSPTPDADEDLPPVADECLLGNGQFVFIDRMSKVDGQGPSDN